MFFEGILTYNSILEPGNQYVFTFSIGRLFEYRSDDWVLYNLRERMSNYGYIVSVSRPLFSNRYIVIVNPTERVSLNEWLEAFDVSWRDMGYGNYSFIQAETGAVSTQPGGVSQIIPSITATVGESAKSLISPIFPYLAIFGGIFILLKSGVLKEYKRVVRRR